MIVAEQLTRRYDQLIAVDSVNFSIQAGEIVGLLGRNGAGKTTIMKMMTGFLEPSAGTVAFDQLDIQNHASEIKMKLGYLAENLPLYPEMTVIDYLDYSAQMHGLGVLDRPSAVSRSIAETDLYDKALEPIGTLSRGYRQRVGVAQAILHAPSFLVMDEPTNGLDPSQTQQMRELIVRLAKKATVVLSTHIMQEVNAICDRVMILKMGNMVLDESLSALRHSSRLLLSTDGQITAVDAALRDIDELQSAVHISDSDGVGQFALPLSGEGFDEQRINTITAEVIRRLVAGNIAVYGVNAEQRDLESLFQDAGEGEVDDA